MRFDPAGREEIIGVFKEALEVLKKKLVFIVSMILLTSTPLLLLLMAQMNDTNSALKITFSTNEDYDIQLYGTDDGLKEVEKDFELVKELGLSRMRVSFSWSNYEPHRGQFQNLEWLRKFVDLANEYEITLMPYLCYAPSWATTGGNWNDPLKNYDYWYDFVYKMVGEFKDDIDYWELWNEQNSYMWFTGTKEEFAKLLNVGAKAVRDADPDAKILCGGLTYPDFYWVEYMIENAPNTFDILPIHSYAESWGSHPVEYYISSGTWFDEIADLLKTKGREQPIWINEIGYPTDILGKTEKDQANFIRRAVATLMATEKISLISWYEIKDLTREFHAIGGEINYHLGLTDSERNKKLGFYTYQNIISIFHNQEFEHLHEGFSFDVKKEHTNPQIIMHPFKRKADDHIFLFVWLYGVYSETEIDVALPGNIKTVNEYSLNGEKHTYNNYSDNLLKNIHLIQDEARLFEIITQ